MEELKKIGIELARAALNIQAIRFSPDNPFTWASGYRMPIYNDNRMFLGNFKHRSLIRSGFQALIAKHQLTPNVIAGTATAGIAPAATLADALQLPLIYVREKAKAHGLENQIEGILRPAEKAVLIEDVISTGGSSIRALTAIRDAGGQVHHCLAIYDYGFQAAADEFKRNDCTLLSVLNFDILLDVVRTENYLTPTQLKELDAWRLDPFGWGEQRGFKRKE